MYRCWTGFSLCHILSINCSRKSCCFSIRNYGKFGNCFFLNQNHGESEVEWQVASSVPTVTETVIVLVTGSSPPKHKSYVLEGNLPFEA